MKSIAKHPFVITLCAILAVFVLNFSTSTAEAQTAIFFGVKDNATQYNIYRYRVGPSGAPVLEATFSNPSLKFPLGMAAGPSGELFVVNQGTSGGFVSRFLSPVYAPSFNGNIPAGPEATFYCVFRGNELFVVQKFSGVKRFIITPSGVAIPNGQIPITATIGELRGITVTPWDELLVTEANGSGIPTIIHRFTFDSGGNALANGTFSDPHMLGSHGMAFSSWGELFVTSPNNHSIVRVVFDAAHNPSYNGSLTGNGLSLPIDLSFAPWGELFVGNHTTAPTPTPPGSYQGISRFTFNPAHVASANGTVITPVPFTGITFVPPPPPSPSLVVNSTADTTDGICDATNCTLREAIAASNIAPGPDTIEFSVTGVINLLTALPSIDDDVVIDGPGATQLTVQRSTAVGTPDFGIFAVSTNGSVTFDGLTISNGGGNGTAANSVLGSGIHNLNLGTVNITHCRLLNNTANYGGALYNYVGTLNISDSTIAGNVVNHPIDDTGGGNGGGIYNYAGRVTITGSTISNNSAFGGGGGIFHYQGDLSVTNSTITGNFSNNAGSAIHHNDAGTANIVNCTIAQNVGSGVYNNGGGGGTATVLNSIVALNGADLQGSITSIGHNVFGTGSVVNPQATDQFAVTAAQLQLGSLTNNGGETETLAISGVSVAFNAGDDCVVTAGGCLATPLITDQRGPGFARKFGDHVDVGAFEASDLSAPATTATPAVAPNASGWNNTDVVVSLTATDEVGGSGVKDIVYSASGAQAIAETTVSCDSANINITSEGVTIISFFARDNAGNTEAVQTITIRIDKHGPTVSCDSADGLWHAIDVSIQCTGADSVSGLNSSGDESFVLSTNVAIETENSDASTDSRSVCDVADNCSTAGPISGNKVDKKAPLITITTPADGSSFILNESVAANYGCSDGGSGVANCSGTVANGSDINTGSLGAKSFAVTATDVTGNSRTTTINYTVNPPPLTALGPAQIWVGLKNSDDVGTKFDLLAEVFKNGIPVGSGQLNDVNGGSSGFNNARLNVISLALSSTTVSPGDLLSITLSVRVAASSGHKRGTARLWYNDAAANTRFNATIGSSTNDYFLLNGSVLGLAAGGGPKKTVDVVVDRNVGGNPFKPFGTWSVTY